MENLKMKNSPEVSRSKNETTRHMGKGSLDLYPIDESNARSLDEINFADIYSQKELEEQKRYVKWVESQTATLEQTRRSQLDRSLESIFVYGVQRTWIENDLAFDDTDAIQASKYDDYKHRIDAAVTLKLKDPRDIENIGDRELVFGVDVTTSGKEETIRNKFDRPHNDKTLEVPQGFTGIDRYSDRRTHRRLPLVPRYVVGLSAAEVENILATVPRNKSGEMMFKRGSIQSELLRFKVLSEICAQNSLYMDTLEDEVDQGDETVDRAYNMLNILDRTMNQSLDDATLRITQSNLFVGKKFKDMKERREKVDELVRKRGEQDEKEYKDKLIMRGESVDPSYRDTYTQIMHVIDEKAENL